MFFFFEKRIILSLKKVNGILSFLLIYPAILESQEHWFPSNTWSSWKLVHFHTFIKKLFQFLSFPHLQFQGKILTVISARKSAWLQMESCTQLVSAKWPQLGRPCPSYIIYSFQFPIFYFLNQLLSSSELSPYIL